MRRTWRGCATGFRGSGTIWITWTLADHRSWLAGDELSIADLSAAAHLSVIDYLGDIPWTDFPVAKLWYQRIKSRPSFRPLLGDTLRGMPASALRCRPRFLNGCGPRHCRKASAGLRIALRMPGRARAGGKTAQLPWDELSRRHGLACRNGGAPRSTEGPVAGGKVGHHAGHELWAGLDAIERLGRKSHGVISTYALNRDYHDVVKGKLKNTCRVVCSATEADVKVFVDTAPLMEKPLAQQAGPWLAGQAHKSGVAGSSGPGSSSARS